MSNAIPIFYACDNNFFKYTVVSLTSMIANASKRRHYEIHILHTDITAENQAIAKRLENKQFSISFDDVTEYLHSIKDKMPIRDYYSKTTYYRLFIADMFPDLKIAIGHFGMVTRENWLEQIKLAKNKNVFIESGGITWLFNEEFYPYPSAVKAIIEAADEVGFEKLMWGSDYPRTMTAITYKMSLDFVEKTTEISEENKKLFLGGNAKKFYGFSDIPVPQKVKNMVED